jgi:hypothetical protein
MGCWLCALWPSIFVEVFKHQEFAERKEPQHNLVISQIPTRLSYYRPPDLCKVGWHIYIVNVRELRVAQSKVLTELFRER